ncbi:YibE/F family protein [Photobacterium leiognathi]|uniref:YibE/F family protein n=1 Tax=Photobacterium leiognathi TaxID=553611 RepID=UPI0029823AB3|nr:YibE/F family protein [Photobacterium leiognathi]
MNMRGVILAFIVLLMACCEMFSQGVIGSQYKVGEVTAVDNSKVTIIGSNRLGEQALDLTLSDDKKVVAYNLMNGAMEYDEYYQVGDSVLVAIAGNDQMRTRVISRYRLPALIGLAIAFSLGLLLYARKVGAKALLSFIGSIVIIVELLIPGLMAGCSPLLVTAVCLLMLCSLIILSVAGWTAKGKSALAGTIIGLIVTMILCVLVGQLLHLDGMTQPLAQPLLFETGMYLNMLDILYAAILVGASGAAMDVAMEMAATMEELKINAPEMSQMDLLRSGFRVGNAVIGTMTTTLLLAYSGSFLTMIMLFASRGNDIMQILNMKVVAAEVARTLIGSLSLIIVAPITAWIACWMISKDAERTELVAEQSTALN